MIHAFTMYLIIITYEDAIQMIQASCQGRWYYLAVSVKVFLCELSVIVVSNARDLTLLCYREA